jgi:general secretion pathway protein C
MQEQVKRYFWVVVALSVALSAFFAAKLVNHIAEGSLLADAKRGPKVTPPAPSPSAPVAAKTKDGKPLVDRNMFCSTCLPPVAVAPTDVAPSDPNMVPMTSLPLLLVATHVTEPKYAHEAFATVLNTATQKQGAYWIHDDKKPKNARPTMIPGAGKVVAIHYKYVDFMNDASGRKERISITGEAPIPPPVVAAVTPEEPKPGGDGDDLTAAIDSGIKKIDDTTFEIDRSLVDKVLANPMAVAKGARVMPSSKNGEPNGFKLYAVRPSSVYAKLGFANGDTLHAINGMELNSMDKAMEVYSKVRDASSLQVNVTRRGKPVTLNYTIR